MFCWVPQGPHHLWLGTRDEHQGRVVGRAPHSALGDAVGVGATAWAAEEARAQGWASLPAAARWGFWA